jgi:hypothetical protein
MVHLRDTTDHCQPAVVYEDWGGKNGTGTISVVVIQPVRIAESPWDSYIEVKPDVINALPFTTWHWPETAYPARMQILRRLAVHAT